MGRPRTLDDETLLDAALVIIRQTGPDSLSFGALAERVDLAGSTLVQRFGTKSQLLRSALLLAWDRLDADTARATKRAGSGRKGVVGLLVSLSGQYSTDDFADQLLLLREDLRDPVLRERGQVWLDGLTTSINTRLSEPIGQLILTQWQGSLTMWAFQRRRPIASYVRKELNDLFDRLNIES